MKVGLIREGVDDVIGHNTSAKIAAYLSDATASSCRCLPKLVEALKTLSAYEGQLD